MLRRTAEPSAKPGVGVHRLGNAADIHPGTGHLEAGHVHRLGLRRQQDVQKLRLIGGQEAVRRGAPGYLPIEPAFGTRCFGDPQISADREINDRRGQVYGIHPQIDDGAYLPGEHPVRRSEM
ncbi:Uncharacterised protein [Mycobacteroides abscessus]|nr:Uncharacterised protein [Mycobacteroides abscessus]